MWCLSNSTIPLTSIRTWGQARRLGGGGEGGVRRKEAQVGGVVCHGIGNYVWWTCLGETFGFHKLAQMKSYSHNKGPLLILKSADESLKKLPTKE